MAPWVYGLAIAICAPCPRKRRKPMSLSPELRPALRERLRAQLYSPWLRRSLVSIGVLGAVALWVEPQEILAEVQRFSAGWVVLALAISALQIMLCAWRWKFTAGLIDVPLRFTYALREYYLALLVNQLLPGGVLGDAGRAHRHANQTQSRGRAWRAVIIERASGQVAVALLTLTALLLSPLWHTALGRPLLTAVGMSVVVGLAVIVVSGLLLRQRFSIWLEQSPHWCQALVRDVKRGLLQRGVWPRQLLSSLVIVLSYGLVMVCAARAIGVELPGLQVLALTPVLLLAMLVPFSVAGWGLREGTAAGVWVLVGLPPAQGVAVSLAYGVLVLLASLPGIWVALSRRGNAQPLGGGGGPEQQVEQGVVATAKGARGGAERTVKRVDRRHFQPRPAGANQQGGDQQVQPVNGARFDELRNRDASPFDQHSGQTVIVQQRDDIAGSELASGIQRQYAALNVIVGRRKCYFRPNDVQRRRRRCIHQRQIARNATTGVQHHASRVRTINMADSQLGVVGAGSTGADDHCINQGAQPMQMNQAFMTVDVVRVAAFRRDAAIHALPQLRDYPRRATGQRGQAVEQFTCFSGHYLRRVPLAVEHCFDRHAAGSLMAQSQQPLPRICQLNTLLGIEHFAVGNTSVVIGVGHDASALKNPLYHAAHPRSAQAPIVSHLSQPGGLHVPD
ncbi:MAG: UPF0104 family protein [Halomonas sp.]|nr:MAG: UPF0104 family protein [Halomonas sp.]